MTALLLTGNVVDCQGERLLGFLVARRDRVG